MAASKKPVEQDEHDAGDEITAAKELLQQAMHRLRNAARTRQGPYSDDAKKRYMVHAGTIQQIINDLDSGLY